MIRTRDFWIGLAMIAAGSALTGVGVAWMQLRGEVGDWNLDLYDDGWSDGYADGREDAKEDAADAEEE